MKLRVKINKQTSRLELDGDQPTLTDLNIHVKEILLPSYGLVPDTEFALSLNGKEPLVDTGQTLSSCGIVSGDLISVILPQSSPLPSPSSTCQNLSGFSTAQKKMEPDRAAHSAFQHSNNEAVPRSSEGSQEAAAAEDEEALETEDEVATGPFIPEPMLCSEAEEGKVPHSLALLHSGAQSQSSGDSLMVALHLLMVETGFQPQGLEVRAGEMPSGWRATGGLYRLQYVHPLCETSLVTVVAVPMGQTLVINATLKINNTMENSRKLSLKPSSYVTQKCSDENAAAVYKDLRKLSHIFKDQLAYPLIATARQAMGLPALFGLPVLPPELLLRILRLLDVVSLVALSAVSRDLRVASEDPSLWRYLCHRDFGVCNPSRTEPRDTDWKELYKKRYIQMKKMNKLRHRPFPYPMPGIYPVAPIPNPPLPFPLYPPGIIGGEYDQRPGIPPSVLPRPRYDPIGPLPGREPRIDVPIGRNSLRPGGSRPADIRRGFI
ncbi:F-box only protein 7 [Chanos chanos]|uniref:F-box only protein 7 n=1 Tax=Chanos chanos TaxID=29144 RepID=A0A6J2W615_CHACN|nr:F-box only protein 7 [Chanos chanos]